MKQIIEEAHKRFEEYKNYAERPDLIRIAVWGHHEKLAYIDLLHNPNYRHCIIYLKLIHKFVNCQDLMQQILRNLGILRVLDSLKMRN